MEQGAGAGGQESVVTTVAVNFNQFCCLFDKFFLFHRVVFSLHMVVGWTNGRVANGWWLNGCLPASIAYRMDITCYGQPLGRQYMLYFLCLQKIEANKR